MNQNFQPDLFTRQAKSIRELPLPTMSYAEATLNYRRYEQQVRHGLGGYDDTNEISYSTIVECSIPASANIFQDFSSYKPTVNVGFIIYGLKEHRNAGELINWWLEKIDFSTKLKNKDSKVGQWIISQAAEMNKACRYWLAVHKTAEVNALEDKVLDLQEQVRLQKLNLSILVIEAAHEQNFTSQERKIKLKELGALDKDLIGLV